jgi:hypothetical protein
MPAAATAGALEAMFKEDQKAAKQIDLATWKRRPLTQRVKEIYSRIWERLL